MPKQPDIKWRNKDLAKLERILNNFNAKIRRVKKKKPKIAEFQPETIKLSALKNAISSRRDFNNEIKALQRYSKRGSEEVVSGKRGLTLTVWKKNEVAIKTATLNRKLTAEIKRAGISAEKGTAQLIEQQNLRHKKFSIDKTEKEFEKFTAMVEKRLIDKDREKKLKEYHQNYKDAITNFLGEEGDNLLKFIEGVTNFEKFFLNSLSDPLLNIGFISDPLEARTIAEKALNNWKKIFK